MNTAVRVSPSKEAIALLEPFVGLSLENVCVPATPDEIAQALSELKQASALGFDTESKPTFRKGEISDGPHVVQFSTPHKAYVFQTRQKESQAAVAEILEAAHITKIGFGLGNDTSLLANKFGIQPKALVDLDTRFRALGHKNSVGAKTAVAMLFNRRMIKSKSVTTSNWSLPKLNERQILYAANDAYAAIRVFEALAKSVDNSAD